MNFSLSSLYDWYRNAIRHPQYRWWVMLGTVIYLISPIDIAPDFIPILGQIDDVVVAGLLFTELSQMLIAKLQARQENNNVNVENASSETVDVDAETVASN
ncbi:YkvA family protein [Pleurocapsa sp. PCC 7319]|uniref:YkvA family protein n=1 Tax=Pleurocapsa sp. PCC 7319 TaxID=118161 RepID=UPI00034DF491|nr:YkvA family protein [Pleurocapsa sp. PCC 7319]